MPDERQLTGNEAAAEAARLARIEVFPAFPITPSYDVMTHIANLIDAGQMGCKFLRVESDHSALAAGVGASLGGARTFSVTNSQGLAMMHEVLHYASGLRLPIVMAVVNRALSAPHCRFADHGDAVAQETTGWLQLFCESNQEVLDTVLQAFRIAEDPRVLLPVMVNLEGYILGDTRQPVVMPEAGSVDEFLPSYGRVVVDVEHPAYINPPTSQELYTEYKFQQHRAMKAALDVVEEVGADFAHRFGRDWSGCVEPYQADDADVLFVTMGSMASAAREAVDRFRENGKAVGLLKIRAFRPFPFEEISYWCGKAKSIAVVDRNIIYGVSGALYREVLMTLAAAGLTKSVQGYVAGLGGRQVTAADMGVIGERALMASAVGSAGGGVTWLHLKRDIIGEVAGRWM